VEEADHVAVLFGDEEFRVERGRAPCDAFRQRLDRVRLLD
jgi:hypothetical protein